MADDRLERLRAAAAQFPGLSLLVLHGSRARGDARPDSDWDFGFVGDASVDLLGLVAELGRAVGSDHVDVADLTRAGALLRFRAARDGVVVFERSAGLFDRFWVDAVRFHCDAGAVLREGWSGVLERLGDVDSPTAGVTR